MPSVPALRRCRLLWLLTILALFGQIVGVAAMPEAHEAGVICSFDEQAPGQPSGHHHHHDCAVCPYCAAVALHAAVATSGPVLPVPGKVVAACATVPPPARAPPAWHFALRFPRGPPAFA